MSLIANPKHRRSKLVVLTPQGEAHYRKLNTEFLAIASTMGVALNEADVRNAKYGFVPHFFVTGDVYRIKGVAPGAVVVQKPYSTHELVRAIERAVQTRGKSPYQAC